MVCRSADQVVVFPTVVTEQPLRVCDLVYAAGIDASSVAIAAVEAVEGYGLFGVEMFELADGSLTVNEIAPRPHNTGHYTLDWGGISQFEAHVRLTIGWPVPQPVGGETAMANLLGIAEDGDLRSATRAALAAVPECHVHWYGKVWRPGRKLGHINAPDRETAVAARDAFWFGWLS
jgi:5-(carboxyamino)imidazole ribonucleotide synthase